MPVASYVPYTISGNLVFLSGQIPIADGALKYVGKLGVDIPLEAGQAAAQLCAINLLAQLKNACDGDLDRVMRCLRLGVFVNAAPEYGQHPEVANGASDLIAAVFGDAGMPAPRWAWARCRAAWRWKWTPSSRSSDGHRKTCHQRRANRRGALEQPGQPARVGRAASLHDLRILRRAGGIRLGLARDRLASRASVGR
jgi:enamine deaminase RidA (YjgF/YER057c/UK114 family)